MNAASWGSTALGIINAYLRRMFVRRNRSFNSRALSRIWALPEPAWRMPEEDYLSDGD